MSVSVSPASCIAARQASRVSSSGSRPGGGRCRTGRPGDGAPLLDEAGQARSAPPPAPPARRGGARCAVGVVVGLEQHLDRHPDRNLLGRAVDDVGGQPQFGLLVDRHQPDHVGRFEPGDPGMVVDGEAGEGGPARRPPRARCPSSRRGGRSGRAGGGSSRSPGSGGTPGSRRGPPCQKWRFWSVSSGSMRKGASAIVIAPSCPSVGVPAAHRPGGGQHVPLGRGG